MEHTLLESLFMKHLVFPSIKLGGLHLMICNFLVFTRQDLHYSEYEELIAGRTGFIEKKKRKKKVSFHGN